MATRCPAASQCAASWVSSVDLPAPPFAWVKMIVRAIPAPAPVRGKLRRGAPGRQGPRGGGSGEDAVDEPAAGGLGAARLEQPQPGAAGGLDPPVVARPPTAKRDRRATIPARSARVPRPRRRPAAAGATGSCGGGRPPAARTGSGGIRLTGRGPGGAGQRRGGSEKAAAARVAVRSGMWLSAGRRRISASSPMRVPSRPSRSAKPSAPPAASRARASASASSPPLCLAAVSGSVTGADRRSMSNPKPAVIPPSFSASSGRMRPGSRAGRARPTSMATMPPSLRRSSNRRRRAPRPALSSRAQRGGSRRSSPARMSASCPTGSGRVMRSAGTGGGRSGATGSGSAPSAWSSRRTVSTPKRRASAPRGRPTRSVIWRRPSRAKALGGLGRQAQRRHRQGGQRGQGSAGGRDVHPRGGGGRGLGAAGGAGAGGGGLGIDRVT
ncbi:MAG: hypothetical protein KatS3mg118_3180 [Paracoccaceae bacterium]|nr:MAG: hypothetical protein KatS3mg118_3180 [Paracoccaceae bacterium]